MTTSASLQVNWGTGQADGGEEFPVLLSESLIYYV